MSKFPSLRNVLNATKRTVFRFPLEVLTALSGTVLSIIVNELKYSNPNKELYQKAIMTCSLCLVLFLSVSLFFIASKKNNILRYATSILLGGLIALFVFNFHKRFTDVEILQFLVLNIALHLLVSFAGFLPRTYNQNEFWEFNKQLFLRILTAVLYSIVLYCGLALAVLAIDELFKVEFYNHIYLHIFLVIGGTFNTIFFLSGVPETNNEQAPLILNYPKGLKNFTQFVLLPLISLYLVILICYEAKILVTLSLPVGWVSYLVLVFAIFGILSFLLVHPIATQTDNLWMRTFNRWFYFLLIPLLGLLYWAILYRINLYGFTHERYYVFMLSVWLSIVVAYFLIQKNPKIKFIPITLCIAGLLSIAGPQGADSISKNSQLSRFEFYMEKLPKKKLTFEEQKELSSIVTFLEENYGIKIMIPFARKQLEALVKKDKDANDFDVMDALGYKYQSQYARSENNRTDIYYSYSENQDSVIDIHGYDFYFTTSNNNGFACTDCLKIENKTYSVATEYKPYGIELKINEDIIPLKTIDFINKSSRFGEDNTEKTTQQVETDKYSISITYLYVAGEVKNGTKVIDNYQVKIMIAIK